MMPFTGQIIAVVTLAGLFSASSVAQEPAAFHKPKLNLVGAAEVLSDRLRLTPAARQLSGAAWLAEKQNIANGFEVLLQFQLTAQGGHGPGADGFAFVLQNAGPHAIAGRGSAGGFAFGDGVGNPKSPGIPRSIAVFFDTYKNGAADPSDNYVAICTNGPIPTMRWPPNRLGVGRKLKVRLKDGHVHEARILYKPPWMSVSLDGGEPEVRVPVDVRTVADESGLAYIGFTASTGNGYENHDILTWHFSPEAVDSNISMVRSDISYLRTICLEDRNLCTPAEAQVQETGPGQYHVILPAHLPWGASIANPGGRKINIANVRGSVCWDNKSPDGCGGPDGVASVNRDPTALLVAGRNPGALVSQTEQGRTFFSVNGIQRAFAGNEGYFEFDVRLE